MSRVKHGKWGSPEYQVWAAMRQRCSNPNNAKFHHYGGRGIAVCERWTQFEHFYSDMGARPSTHHSLERVNNDGNYEPLNCRWATAVEQARNTRRNRWLTFGGQTQTLSTWAKQLELSDARRVKAALGLARKPGRPRVRF